MLCIVQLFWHHILLHPELLRASLLCYALYAIFASTYIFVVFVLLLGCGSKCDVIIHVSHARIPGFRRLDLTCAWYIF